MQREARAARPDSVAPRPLAELLRCPAPIASGLNDAVEHLNFDAGDVVFRQFSSCRGLFLLVSGQFQRKAERVETRLTLGAARPGELVELAAVLGDGRHTYTLAAQCAGSALLLPMEALNRAFQLHPPLRMQLLEELAREVSRAYCACSVARLATMRKHHAASEAD